MQQSFDNERQPLAKPQKGGMALNQTQEHNESTLNEHLNGGGGSYDHDDAAKKKKIKYGIIGGVALVAITLAIVLPLTLGGGGKPKPPVPPVPAGEEGLNFYYIVNGTVKNTAYSRRGVVEFDEARFKNRSALYTNTNQDTQRMILEQAKKAKIGVNWNRSVSTGFNNPIQKRLEYEFDMIDFKVARFQLTTADEDRFTIPEEVLAKPPTDQNMRLESIGHGFKSSSSATKDPLHFSFFDVLKPENVFVSTEKQSLIFTDKYIQMDFVLPSEEVYGFGERTTTHRLREGAWGMWASSHTSTLESDEGLGRGGQYGVHPFLLARQPQSQQYIGMYFRNANAQLPIIRYTDGTPKQTILSYITLGGQLEVYFFLSGSARQVIQDYHRIFGKAQLPPFWALGWQEASQSVYNSTAERDNQLNLIRTVEHYKNMSLPLEAVYIDQKQMNKKRNFQLNEELITNMADLRFVMDSYKTKLIAYVDAAIYAPEAPESVDPQNPSYNAGNIAGVFLKSNHLPSKKYNNNLVGLRGLDKCVYIDWFNLDKTSLYWYLQLEEYMKLTMFDGLWTTNNEAYSENQGEMNLTDSDHNPRKRLLQAGSEDYDTQWFSSFNENSTSSYFLPFTPQFKQKGPYDQNAPSLNATHSNFRYWNKIEAQWMHKNETEYNLHSLYGHAMMMTTAQVLNNLSLSNTSRLFDKRPFLLTRSTFTGTNKYASYAIRQKYRTWQSLQNTIPHMMNMNMFGFTHSGADACGAIDLNASSTMDEELCLRWIQLATFFPLARHSQDFTHNDSYVSGPLGFKDETKKKQVWASMRDRMQYLRFMYTCLFESSQFGGSCFDPLYFHYSNLNLNGIEDTTGVNDTFIFGGAVKVSPIVTQTTQDTFKSHFPKGKWLNLNTLETLTVEKDGLVDLKVQPTVNAHLRPGSLIPWTDLSNPNTTALRTEDLMSLPIALVINRNERNVAKGTLFLDDGISQSVLSSEMYEYYNIEHKGGKAIQVTLAKGSRGAQGDMHAFDRFVIGNAQDLKDTDFACVHLARGGIDQLKTLYDAKTQSLTIYREMGIDAMPLKFSELGTIFYGKNGTDLNLCMEKGFEYMVDPADDLKSLGNPEASIKLLHKEGALPPLKLTLRTFDEGIVNVQWTYWTAPAQGQRVHQPVPDVLVDTSRKAQNASGIGSFVNITRDPFSIKIVNTRESQEPLFEIDRIVYDQYLNWIGMKAYTQKGQDYRGVLGLGERSQSRSNLFYKDGIYSMWAFDDPTKAEDGELPGKQGYGAHPFFMYQHSNPDQWVGVFSKHSQAQDWVIVNNAARGQTVLEQISTGGITDLYIMINSHSPDSVVGYYQRIIGKPVLMPQWALGWHQCKYCLKNVQAYREVVQGYRNLSIPLDAQWADIDYMHNYQNFKVDKLYFGDLQSYVKENKNTTSTGHAPLKFVPIVDAGISAHGGNYSTLKAGMDKQVFLKMRGSQQEPVYGKVWPNYAVFPDFFHANTKQWWHDELTQFHEDQVEFDGLWLDMNEAANFCQGACLERQKPEKSDADLLSYTPTGRSLEYKSLPLDIVHANGMTSLDTHNIYGAHQIATTHEWFKKRNQRPFIVGRSTFAGTGKFAGKWLGDSSSTYSDMQRSVTGTMMMNIFGIPFVGGDICGFTGEDAEPEMCTRWHQVGAFQPFSRNHRDCDGAPQEPFRFVDNKLADNTTYTQIMKKAILDKYSLLKYYYTQMFLLSTDPQYTGTFYKPVFFEFPKESMAYTADVSENVMLGSALKLSVKTSRNKNWTEESNAYFFPKGIWCDILHPATDCVTVRGGAEMQIQPAGLKDYQVHLRDGFIVPFQDAAQLNISSSEDLQKHPVDLIISPQNFTKENGTTANLVEWRATGVYVNDNGNVVDLDKNHNHYLLSFTYSDVRGPNDTDIETIKITVSQKIGGEATNYYNNETKCMKINQNDVLGGIFINDEFEFFQHKAYELRLIRPDQTTDVLGQATYSARTNRLEYFGASEGVPEVCLNYIQEIIFIPVILPPV